MDALKEILEAMGATNVKVRTYYIEFDYKGKSVAVNCRNDFDLAELDIEIEAAESILMNNNDSLRVRVKELEESLGAEQFYSADLFNQLSKYEAKCTCRALKGAE